MQTVLLCRGVDDSSRTAVRARARATDDRKVNMARLGDVAARGYLQGKMWLLPTGAFALIFYCFQGESCLLPTGDCSQMFLCDFGSGNLRLRPTGDFILVFCVTSGRAICAYVQQVTLFWCFV